LSWRSGFKQIWLREEVDGQFQSRQLSQQMANKSGVESFSWLNDGKLIVYISQKQLHLLNLDGETQALAAPFEVLEIYQHLNQYQLLLSVHQDNQIKLVSFDIKSGKVVDFFQGEIRWAQLAGNNSLYITDKNRVFSQVIDNQAIPVPEFLGMLIWAKFLYKDNDLLVLDDDNNIWQFDSTKDVKSHLLSLTKDVKFVEDINLDKKQLLFTRIESAKKEIVMFHE